MTQLTASHAHVLLEDDFVGLLHLLFLDAYHLFELVVKVVVIRLEIHALVEELAPILIT